MTLRSPWDKMPQQTFQSVKSSHVTTHLGLGISTGTAVLIFTRLDGHRPDSETGRETDVI